ncbi:Retrovirus-related Pol polyprotein from transposon 17.6 [Dictyocoela muelleri]|nr:Retrovirus-related Pol polyprotein from transposon 17.6 [Dictyocoela muelleri]
MDVNSIPYTAFSINNKRFEFLRMPFRLANAPRIFQKAMDRILGDLSYVKVYIDDILIHSENEDLHHEHLENVLRILHENNLSINFDKCEFLKGEVKFLGHLITSNGIRPIIDKLQGLRNFHPKNKRHLQRILGIINWYRGYFKKISQKTLFLTKKLSKDSKFTW